MEFTEDQILRYSRHILLPEVGGDGQEKLLNAKVVLVGAGGLGSPVGYYLAAAGVGTIGVIDNDRVELFAPLLRELEGIHSGARPWDEWKALLDRHGVNAALVR